MYRERLRLFYLLRRWWSLNNHERIFVVEAVIGIVIAHLAVLFMPFPAISKIIGYPSKFDMPSHDEMDKRCMDVIWAVSAVVRYAPWKVVCLPQCIAAAIMLRRRGIAYQVHFGLRKTDFASPDRELLSAHSWLEANGIVVLGGSSSMEFTKVGTFSYFGRNKPSLIHF